jgi:hypothetical protein
MGEEVRVADFMEMPQEVVFPVASNITTGSLQLSRRSSVGCILGFERKLHRISDTKRVSTCIVKLNLYCGSAATSPSLRIDGIHHPSVCDLSIHLIQIKVVYEVQLSTIKHSAYVYHSSRYNGMQMVGIFNVFVVDQQLCCSTFAVTAIEVKGPYWSSSDMYAHDLFVSLPKKVFRLCRKVYLNTTRMLCKGGLAQKLFDNMVIHCSDGICNMVAEFLVEITPSSPNTYPIVYDNVVCDYGEKIWL